MNEFKFLRTTKGLVATMVSIFVVAFFLGMQYKAYQVRSAISDVFSDINLSIDEEYEEMEEEKVLIEKGVGEVVELATINVQVNEVVETQNLDGGGFGNPTVANAGAKFVVIDLNVTNTTSAPFSFWTDGLVVIDSQDRLFEATSAIGEVTNYLEARDLAPGIQENGKIVYQIPEDVETYSLHVFKGGTNEEYSIQLK